MAGPGPSSGWPILEGGRVLMPATSAWRSNYDRIEKVDLVEDMMRPDVSPSAADYLGDLPLMPQPWIAAVDAAGHGLQTLPGAVPPPRGVDVDAADAALRRVAPPPSSISRLPSPPAGTRTWPTARRPSPTVLATAGC